MDKEYKDYRFVVLVGIIVVSLAAASIGESYSKHLTTKAAMENGYVQDRDAWRVRWVSTDACPECMLRELEGEAG